MNKKGTLILTLVLLKEHKTTVLCTVNKANYPTMLASQWQPEPVMLKVFLHFL